jgi:stress response protein YsnF
MASSVSSTRTIPTPGEVRVPVTEARAEVRKEEREIGQVGICKEVDVETQHISEGVTQTRVEVERRPVDEEGEADVENVDDVPARPTP